jgi:hypothetical protein
MLTKSLPFKADERLFMDEKNARTFMDKLEEAVIELAYNDPHLLHYDRDLEK